MPRLDLEMSNFSYSLDAVEVDGSKASSNGAEARFSSTKKQRKRYSIILKYVKCEKYHNDQDLDEIINIFPSLHTYAIWRGF